MNNTKNTSTHILPDPTWQDCVAVYGKSMFIAAWAGIHGRGCVNSLVFRLGANEVRRAGITSRSLPGTHPTGRLAIDSLLFLDRMATEREISMRHRRGVPLKTATSQLIKKTSNRSGATLVEAALTLPLLLLIIFATIDIGFAVQRAGICHEAARIGARMAVVHGADARENGPWTSSLAVAAIHNRIDPILRAAAIDPNNVQVTVTWQKIGTGLYLTSPGNQVTVRVSIDSPRLVSFLRLSPLTVSSDSCMVISN